MAHQGRGQVAPRQNVLRRKTVYCIAASYLPADPIGTGNRNISAVFPFFFREIRIVRSIGTRLDGRVFFFTINMTFTLLRLIERYISFYNFRILRFIF